MPPRRDRRRDEGFDPEEDPQLDAAQPLLLAPRAQVNFRNLDLYKFDKLAKFDRPSFLLFARKFRHTTARCLRDNVTPTPLQELFDPSIIGRVMKAAGLERQDRDEFGAAWVAMDQEELQTSLNAHFLGHATQQEQQQLFEDVTFPAFSNWEGLQVAYETFCADWHRLTMDLTRAAEALDDPAQPLAPSTRTKVLLTKLSSHCSVFLHLFKAKKFEDENAVLDLIDPYLDGVVLFQRQHLGCPGISWPSLSGGDPPPVKHRPASVNSLDAEHPLSPDPTHKAVSLDEIAAQLNALQSAVSKFDKSGGGAAKRSAFPECSHCGGRHSLSDCWFRHVRKPKGGGFAVITPEEREKTRVKRGLPAKAPRSRTNSPHPRPRSDDDSVNSDAYVLAPCTSLARACFGQRALRRARGRQQRTATLQAFSSELVEAGILPQPETPPSLASVRRRFRRLRAPVLSPAEKRAAKAAAATAAAAAAVAAAAAAAAVETASEDGTALSWVRLAAGDAFTDACALLDTGTTHNFVRPSIATHLIAAGARTRVVPRSIRAGGHMVGDSSREVKLLITRERNGVQQASSEWCIPFDAGYDVIIGLPALRSWGWINFSGVRRPEAGSTIAQVAAMSASRVLTGVRKSRAVLAANSSWAAFPSSPALPRPFAAVTEQRRLAAKRDLRECQAGSATALVADWRLRTPPAVGCLRGSRAADDSFLPSPVEPPSNAATSDPAASNPTPFLTSNEKPRQACRVRFLILETPLSKQRAVEALTRRAKSYLKSGATVIPIGCRLFRVVAVRPTVSRRSGTGRQCSVFSLDAQRSNFQLKEDKARAEGDDVKADFYLRLDKLCRMWGYFDEKRIFSKDLTLPSKMNPMRIGLIGNARRMPMRLAMRRHSQPQKDEVRKQLIAMLKQLVVERAGPDAWMSCVHLVRKPDAAPSATSPAAAGGDAAPVPPPPDQASLNALSALGLPPNSAEISFHCPKKKKKGSAPNLPNFSEITGHNPPPVTATIELGTPELQRWADLSGCGGAAAMEVASLFEMMADIQVGPSTIRWRFTIDFRKLNDVTVEEFYPFPETRECIESLAGSELFGSLDLSSMYWQIEVHPADRHLTGFATEDGCFVFRRVPFGLKNACAHAQKEFRAVLRSDARLDSVNNYLDDCFWGCRGASKYEDFLRITAALFEVCEKFNVKINASKTFLGEDSLRVLGHRVDKAGMHIDPARQDALLSLDTPSGKLGLTQVKAALGAMQYVRSFIPSFSTVAAPLTGMTTFVWGSEQARAWAELKRLIKTSGVLCNPDYTQPFYLKADASKRGLGGCLYQWGVGANGAKERRVIAYCSKKFCPRESNWKTIEQECFSVIYSLQKFRPLIQGCRVTVLNDHRNLVWLRSNESSSKCVRWSMVLDEYSITWRHLPGKATLAQEEDATVPDGLSRSFGSSSVPVAPQFISDREERLLSDLDVQLSALSVEASADGVVWDHRAPLEEQMAVLVLCIQACVRAEPAFISALGADRATRIAERDATKAAAADALMRSRAAAAAERIAEQQLPATGARVSAAPGQQAGRPSVVANAVPAESSDKALGRTAPAERLPSVARAPPLPPTTAAELASASRTMLAAARRLANAGRLMAHEDASWQHNRATAAPESYGGQIQQRGRWVGHEAGGRLPDDAGPLPKWSELNQAAKRAAFEQAHCFPASHAGAIPTRDRIIKRGNFSLARGELERMLEDVREFKAACPTCQLLRKWDQEDDTLSSIPARPWVDVSIDFLMVSPTDHLGHLAILVVEDNFSGACELIPVKSVTAETLARECVKVFGRTNAPITIRSDQGPAFESLISNALMRALGVVQYRVLHGHHRANGIVERTNSDVVRMLRACVLDDRVVPSALISWAELCPWIQRNINRAMSSKTRKAPVQLLYGDRVDLDRELFDPPPENLFPGSAVKIGGYVQALIDSYDACLRAALAHQAAQLARAVASRRLVPQAQFVPGEWVLVRLPADQLHDKMEPRWEGPFRVLARTGDHSYTVLDTVRAAERRVRDVHVTSVCRFDWSWLDIPEDDEAARAAYAAKLAVRAAARPMGTPCTILAIRQLKTARLLSLQEGRGLIPLSKLEFQCAFTELGVQDAWVPFIRLEGGDLLTSFLLENRNWR